jgi:Protein of unknown function (DUF1353)
MRLTCSIVWLLACLVGLTGSSAGQENWGRFKGEIVITFLSDGRNVRLEQPFAYVDPRDREWSVPAGTTTDGASVPQFFWIAFPPFTGKYRTAAVVHDYYCQVRTHPWRDTHEVFYSAMRAAGVSEITAKSMYAAVYSFGPRWGVGAQSRGPGIEKYQTEEQQLAFYRDLEAWIGLENPSLQEINRQLDEGKVPKRRR